MQCPVCKNKMEHHPKNMHFGTDEQYECCYCGGILKRHPDVYGRYLCNYELLFDHVKTTIEEPICTHDEAHEMENGEMFCILCGETL